jgi:hypothetical protein
MKIGETVMAKLYTFRERLYLKHGILTMIVTSVYFK